MLSYTCHWDLLSSKYWWALTEQCRAAIHNLFSTRDQLHGRQFFHGLGEGGMVSGWFKHIPFFVHLISIIIMSALPQALDPGGGDHCFTLQPLRRLEGGRCWWHGFYSSPFPPCWVTVGWLHLHQMPEVDFSKSHLLQVPGAPWFPALVGPVLNPILSPNSSLPFISSLFRQILF